MVMILVVVVTAAASIAAVAFYWFSRTENEKLRSEIGVWKARAEEAEKKAKDDQNAKEAKIKELWEKVVELGARLSEAQKQLQQRQALEATTPKKPPKSERVESPTTAVEKESPKSETKSGRRKIERSPVGPFAEKLEKSPEKPAVGSQKLPQKQEPGPQKTPEKPAVGSQKSPQKQEKSPQKSQEKPTVGLQKSQQKQEPGSQKSPRKSPEKPATSPRKSPENSERVKYSRLNIGTLPADENVAELKELEKPANPTEDPHALDSLMLPVVSPKEVSESELVPVQPVEAPPPQPPVAAAKEPEKEQQQRAVERQGVQGSTEDAQDEPQEVDAPEASGGGPIQVLAAQPPASQQLQTQQVMSNPSPHGEIPAPYSDEVACEFTDAAGNILAPGVVQEAPLRPVNFDNEKK